MFCSSPLEIFLITFSIIFAPFSVPCIVRDSLFDFLLIISSFVFSQPGIDIRQTFLAFLSSGRMFSFRPRSLLAPRQCSTPLPASFGFSAALRVRAGRPDRGNRPLWPGALRHFPLVRLSDGFCFRIFLFLRTPLVACTLADFSGSLVWHSMVLSP